MEKENNIGYRILGKKKDIVQIITDEIIFEDAQSALDLLGSVQYETNCDKLIVDKSCILEEFFNLRTGVAGNILQKFINYHKKIAIVGIIQCIQATHLKILFMKAIKETASFLFLASRKL